MVPDKGVVIDVETTGFAPTRSRIVSYYAIKIDFNEVHEGGGEIVGKTTGSIVDPKVEINNSRIHGMTNEDVQGKPHFGSKAKPLRRFIGRSPIIGYNVSFDLRFLNVEFKRAGQETLGNNDAHDAMQGVKEVYKDLFGRAPPKIALTTALDRFGLVGRVSSIHSVKEDTELTAKLAYCLWLMSNRKRSAAVRELENKIRLNVELKRKSRDWQLPSVIRPRRNRI